MIEAGLAAEIIPLLERGGHLAAHDADLRTQVRKQVAAEIEAHREGNANYAEDNFWAGMQYAARIAEGGTT